jgi:hypothetical protein
MAKDEDSTPRQSARAEVRAAAGTWLPSIVTASTTVVLVLVAVAGKSSYTPKILDEILGITKYVEKTAFSKIVSIARARD